MSDADDTAAWIPIDPFAEHAADQVLLALGTDASMRELRERLAATLREKGLAQERVDHLVDKAEAIARRIARASAEQALASARQRLLADADADE
jgi:enoyl-CoA hydratase/carnithine racemase